MKFLLSTLAFALAALLVQGAPTELQEQEPRCNQKGISLFACEGVQVNRGSTEVCVFGNGRQGPNTFGDFYARGQTATFKVTSGDGRIYVTNTLLGKWDVTIDGTRKTFYLSDANGSADTVKRACEIRCPGYIYTKTYWSKGGFGC